MIVNLGLILIIIGWGIQLLSNEREMKKSFLLTYVLGVMLLAINGFLGEITFPVILQLISSLTALAVFWKIRK